jgi:hypothetical protein
MKAIKSRISPILMGMFLAAGGSLASAQDATPTPPKVLQITREWLKPGKTGAVHDASEAAFVAAASRGKLHGHYVALNSISGKARALFMFRYPSFAAMEEDQRIIDKSPALTAEFERALSADGELLEGTDTGVFTYDEELSYHPHPDLSHARYYELTLFHVRPGHDADWHKAVKMYQDACDKAKNGAHWGMYDLAFGGEGGTYLALSHRDSMKEIDDIFAGGKKFVEAMGGEAAMQKFDELVGQAIDSSRAELFAINPKQSYAEDAWIKGDPDFWQSK